MAQPAYVLNMTRFEKLLNNNGYGTRTAFINQSGIPRRTFQSVLTADRELSGRTIRYFLDAFPGTSFEYLFAATPQRKLAA